MKSLHPTTNLTKFKSPSNLDQFWVIIVISNYVRYRRRYELFHDFIDTIKSSGVKYVIVEEAIGNRPFMVTNPNDIRHLQVRVRDELWRKENAINLGVRHALHISRGRVKQIAWIDADCRPARPYKDWFDETWHQLQHYDFVQMWQNLQDVDIDYNPIGTAQPGFMYNYITNGTPEFVPIGGDKYAAPTEGAPGLAWAANIEAFNHVGGLIDYALLGAADWYMAHALIENLHKFVGVYNGTAFMNRVLHWQTRCERYIKKNVGYVPGIVYHDFHGPKSKRFYNTRDLILEENNYNPDTDIKYDAQGSLQLETWEPRQKKMRDQIRGYFRSRNEDSIDND